MKKYVFSALAVAIPVIMLAIYYIQWNINVKAYDKISLETISGNKDEMKHIEVNGTLTAENSLYFMEVSRKGTSVKAQSFYETLFDGHKPYERDEERERKKLYRSFMRGKGSDLLVETKDQLIYVNPFRKSQYTKIRLSVLDKNNKQEKEVAVELPKELQDKKALSVSAFDLQSSEAQFLLTATDSQKREIVMLTADLKEGTVMKTKSLLNVPKKKGDRTIEIEPIYRSLKDRQGEKSRQSAYFSITESVRTPVEDGGESVKYMSKTVYKAANGFNAVEKVYEQSGNDAEADIFQSDEWLLIHQYDKDEIKVFNTETKEATLFSSSKFIGPYPFILNGKLYEVNNSMNQKSIHIRVTDIQSKKVTYEGEINPPHHAAVSLNEIMVNQ
ncbi:hypothetical protein [Bacillus sp. 1P06AnD]|uniref:hypothetical protein n=1 Tax=Bacillus sp. 1P06AnD TaxID=3132208 RepID=UPI0039A3664A